MHNSAQASARGRRRRSAFVRLFGRDRSGASALEFGIVAAPFFALLMALLEVSLVFFGSFTLENAVDRAARLIRTGQAQQAGFSQAQFKQSVCDNVYALIDCASGLKIEVVRFENFNDISLQDPLDGDGELKDGFGYDPGNGGDVVVVRAFYEWDLIAAFPGIGLGNMAGGNRLLAAAAAFRNEPFDN